MARSIERLTAHRVERFKTAHEPKPGMYADGGGLYLRVTAEGARNWVLRYMLDRRLSRAGAARHPGRIRRQSGGIFHPGRPGMKANQLLTAAFRLAN